MAQIEHEASLVPSEGPVAPQRTFSEDNVASVFTMEEPNSLGARLFQIGVKLFHGFAKFRTKTKLPSGVVVDGVGQKAKAVR